MLITAVRDSLLTRDFPPGGWCSDIRSSVSRADRWCVGVGSIVRRESWAGSLHSDLMKAKKTYKCKNCACLCCGREYGTRDDLL